ncbi:MAG TPA: hypothetical protein VF766_08485, partial [Pyrinomonadaceae bacterium]
MSNSNVETRRRGDAATRRRKGKGLSRRVFVSARLRVILLTFGLLLAVGCRQDMQDQPRYEVYEPSGFFKDGLSSRPLVEGTVPRGYLKADKQLYTGKMDKAGATTTTSAAGNSTGVNQDAGQGGQETSSGAGG